LSEAEGPKSVNLKDENGRLAGEFATIPVLAYGKQYALEPDHTGPIVLVAGEMKRIPGRILQAKDDWYLVTRMEHGGIDYILLNGSGQIHTEPGGERALYSRWRLVHESILNEDGIPRTLIQFDAGKGNGFQR
jgi:hypothetical protein